MRTSISIFYVCIAVVSAEILRERALSYDGGRWRRAESPHINELLHTRDTQTPLKPIEDAVYDTKHVAKLAIESGEFLGFPFYYTNIALRTPNQAFRVLIDLNYGGLVVRAPNCNAPWSNCGLGFEYNHSVSSTYRDESERFGLHLPGQFINGDVSTDYLQLVRLNISNVTFGEVDDFHGENLVLLALEDVVDGYMSGFCWGYAS